MHICGLLEVILQGSGSSSPVPPCTKEGAQNRLNALPFDPATNSDPLRFNNSNGPLVTECPFLENTAENGKKRKRTSLPPGTVQYYHGPKE
ncbi:hypothetical protein L3Q82_005694 [Scortum barcoo]|uniref:Uncharacterized protein n=1 Tax=Scortum barcoo TaxID=214431 RepID=A0ACB8V730_9TELE|nr:hypothetical protein L3Q82_005694 [Scortum barcoo]